MTEETAARLVGVGIDPPPGLTEHGAQALLLVKAEIDGDADGAPSCFQTQFKPQDPRCSGCVFSPQCWRLDLGYLHRLRDGTGEPPADVPEQVVAARVEWAASLEPPPPPPVRASGGRKKPPPAPAR